MWTCNICFKTFDRSTSYYNHRKSHKPNYEIDSSKNETNSNEESSIEEFSLDSQMPLNEYNHSFISHPILLTDINQEFEILNPTFSKDNDQSKDQSDNEQDFSNEFEHPILEITNPTFSENSDQSSDQSSIEQDFPNEIYRDFIKLVKY